MNRGKNNLITGDQSYKDTLLSPTHYSVDNDEQSKVTKSSLDDLAQQLTGYTAGSFDPQIFLNDRHIDQSALNSSGYVSHNDSSLNDSTTSANPEQQLPSQYVNKTTSKCSGKMKVYTGATFWIRGEKKEAFKDLQAFTCPLHPCYVTTDELKNKTQAFTCPQCKMEGF